MSNQRHVIKKQVLELVLGNRNEAYRLQNRVSRIYNEKITGLLDDIFCDVIEPDQYALLDKIEIDLGIIKSDNLEEQFPERLRLKLRESLINQLHYLNPQTTTGLPQSSNVEKKTSLKEKLLIGSDEYILKLLRHFLLTGMLPWWADDLSQINLGEKLTALLKSSPAGIIKMLKELIKYDHVVKRLIYQFPESVINEIIAAALKDKRDNIIIFIKDIEDIIQQSVLKVFPPERVKFLLQRSLILISFDNKTDDIEKEVLETFALSVSQSERLKFEEIISSFEEVIKQLKSQKIFLSSRIIEAVEKIINETKQSRNILYDSLKEKTDKGYNKEKTAEDYSEISPLKLEKEKEERLLYKKKKLLYDKTKQISSRSLLENEENSIDKKKQIQDSRLTPKTSRRYKENIPGKDEMEAISSPEEQLEELYIENSGLILLHPYLGKYFESLTLLHNGKFINDDANIHGILLAQYLVTGHTSIDEFVLLLNKLLCGWDITEPVNKNINISEREVNESENLLQSVITHWSALKNTSIQGLRSSFLKRNGILVKKDNGWLLKVERKEYDILLNYLPWSIQMIKLSWMKTLLYVEW